MQLLDRLKWSDEQYIQFLQIVSSFFLQKTKCHNLKVLTPKTKHSKINI